MKPTRDQFAEVADALGIQNPQFVEKDYYAIQLLRLINNVDQTNYILNFAGGTCLSKAHIDTHRFSEDVDIKLKPKPHLLEVSKARQKKYRKAVSSEIEELITKSKIFILRGDPVIKDEYRSQIYQIDYPCEATRQAESIKSHLRLELTECSLEYEPKLSSIFSLYAKMNKCKAEVSQCACVDMKSIAAEKCISLLRRIAMFERGIEDEEDIYLVRHVYDLKLISEKIKNLDDLKPILNAVIKNDQVKYKKHSTFQANPIDELRYGHRCLLEKEKYLEYYEKYLTPLVYPSNPVTWKERLDNVENLLYLVCHNE